MLSSSGLSFKAYCAAQVMAALVHAQGWKNLSAEHATNPIGKEFDWKKYQVKPTVEYYKPPTGLWTPPVTKDQTTEQLKSMWGKYKTDWNNMPGKEQDALWAIFREQPQQGQSASAASSAVEDALPQQPAAKPQLKRSARDIWSTVDRALAQEPHAKRPTTEASSSSKQADSAAMVDQEPAAKWQRLSKTDAAPIPGADWFSGRRLKRKTSRNAASSTCDKPATRADKVLAVYAPSVQEQRRPNKAKKQVRKKADTERQGKQPCLDIFSKVKLLDETQLCSAVLYSTVLYCAV